MLGGMKYILDQVFCLYLFSFVGYYLVFLGVIYYSVLDSNLLARLFIQLGLIWYGRINVLYSMILRLSTLVWRRLRSNWQWFSGAAEAD